jgi:hypothetical protein
MIATRVQELSPRTTQPIESGQSFLRRPSPTPVPDMVPDILMDVQRSLHAEAKLIPHQSNWASTLMDPCERRLVYQRAEWDKAEPPQPRLQGIFETGKRLEKLVLNILNEIGASSHPVWELLQPASRAKDNLLTQYQIGGIPDCFLRIVPKGGRPRLLGPVEIKTMDPNTFRRVQTVADMTHQSWTQRYIGQLTLYELAANFDRGWFLLVNKANLYEYRWMELPLDYCLAESLLQKASRVNAHIQQGSLPAKLNDPAECGRCPFACLCCPDHKTGGNLTVIANPQLEEVLDRLEELEETRQEIGTLERQRDKILENCKGQDVVSGRWMITWTKKEGTTPAKSATPWVRWYKEIQPIG